MISLKIWVESLKASGGERVASGGWRNRSILLPWASRASKNTA
jgi:hypothetical protein